jgi:hypothetical protein
MKKDNIKNIHILSTDKPSRLYEFGGKYNIQENSQENFRSYNIYITSDEKIEEGDWFLSLLTGIVVPTKSKGKNSKAFYNHKKTKKIILTTDPDLIKDGVQEIPEDFLEWFCSKNGKVDFVYIESYPVAKKYNSKGEYIAYSGWEYKITIPQKESEEQETLENYAHNYFNMHETNNYKALKQGFEAGARWQRQNSEKCIVKKNCLKH